MNEDNFQSISSRQEQILQLACSMTDQLMDLENLLQSTEPVDENIRECYQGFKIKLAEALEPLLLHLEPVEQAHVISLKSLLQRIDANSQQLEIDWIDPNDRLVPISRFLQEGGPLKIETGNDESVLIEGPRLMGIGSGSIRISLNRSAGGGFIIGPRGPVGLVIPLGGPGFGIGDR